MVSHLRRQWQCKALHSPRAARGVLHFVVDHVVIKSLDALHHIYSLVLDLSKYLNILFQAHYLHSSVRLPQKWEALIANDVRKD